MNPDCPIVLTQTRKLLFNCIICKLIHLLWGTLFYYITLLCILALLYTCKSCVFVEVNTHLHFINTVCASSPYVGHFSCLNGLFSGYSDILAIPSKFICVSFCFGRWINWVSFYLPSCKLGLRMNRNSHLAWWFCW